MFFSPLFGMAQDTGKPTVVLPSPTSMEFDKYLNYPVSESTGVPEITIPLYTIKEGDIEIPIYLSYHASGIKYGQTNGDVGVGWVLQPGYRISRTIHGAPDEYYDMADYGELNNLYTSQSKDYYLTRFFGRETQDIPFNGSQIDGEFDMFTFSTNGESGRFVIRNRETKEIQKISTSVTSIDYLQKTDNSIHIFNIKDGKGNHYRYGQNFAATRNSIENNSGYAHSPISPSSWMLTDIQDVHGNTVSFDYSTFYETSEGNNTLTVVSGSSTSGEILSPTHAHHSLSDPSFENYVGQKVEKIKSSQIEVLFFRKQSTGIIDSLIINSINGKRLKKVEFKTAGNLKHTFLDELNIYDGSSQEAQNYKFSYINRTASPSYLNYLIADYWEYYKYSYPLVNYLGFPKFTGYSYCSDNYQYFLTELEVFDRNALANTESQMFTLNKIEYPTGGYTSYEYEQNQYMGFTDTSPGQMVRKYAGIRIKKISSYSNETDLAIVREYKYGQNEDGLGVVYFDIARNVNYISDFPNGLSFTTTGRVAMGRQVVFNSKPVGEIGGFMDAPVSYSKVSEYLYGGEGLYESSIKGGKIEHVFDIPHQVTYLPFSVNQFYNGTDAMSTAICNGSSDVYITPTLIYYQHSIMPWANSYPLSKIIYKSEGNVYVPVKKEEYYYSDNITSLLKGFKVRRFYISSSPYSTAFDYYYSGINSLFEYGEYEIATGDRVLNRKVVTDQLDKVPIEYESLFTYNEKLQQVKVEEKINTGTSNISQVVYPIDYAPGTSFIDQMRQANLLSYPVEQVKYKKTGTDHRILEGAVTKYLLGGKGLIDEVYNLETLNPIALASFKFSNRASGVLPTEGTKTVFGADTRYRPRLKYDLYDNKGNPLQYTVTNGPSTAYLWDYNGQYPIAEVKNAVQTDVAYTGFEADGKGNWSYAGNTVMDNTSPTGKRRYALSSGQMSKAGLSASRNYILEYWIKGSTHPVIVGGAVTDPVWLKSRNGWWHYRRVFWNTTSITLSGSAIVDDVRLYPVDAQMTTYTYDPLVGMSSETDASGRSVYYEYDGTLRLKSIKDQDGNILKNHIYHYKP